VLSIFAINRLPPNNSLTGKYDDDTVALDLHTNTRTNLAPDELIYAKKNPLGWNEKGLAFLWWLEPVWEPGNM